MRRIDLTPALTDALITLRTVARLDYDQCAERLGVSRKVVARWCRDLALNAPMSRGRVPGNGAPVTTPERRRELQRNWCRDNRLNWTPAQLDAYRAAQRARYRRKRQAASAIPGHYPARWRRAA